MKIAVIGSGVSGLTASLILQSKHKVTLYEKNSTLGGHANTVNLSIDNVSHKVETGFIVLNDHNYPNFIKLLKYLNIDTNKSTMSFSVSVDQGVFEYSSSYLGLIAQPKNIFDPKYWEMLRDINYFYNNALKDINYEVENETLGEYLKRCKYSEKFINYHLLPMTASIWSCPKNVIINFPVKSLLEFFKNHKLLNLYDRPIWKTVTGGSREYIKSIEKRLDGPIYLNNRINSIIEKKDGMYLKSSNGIKKYDAVILACHADESHFLLKDKFKEQDRVLSRFSFQKNTAILHSDINFMPKRKSVWSSWNYISQSGISGNLSVTYWMNKLQNLKSTKPILLSLNPKRLPNPDLIYGQYTYSHPVFDNNAILTQKELNTIQGKNNIWYCGAWTKYGFHEDGVRSAIDLARDFNVDIPWSKKTDDVLYAAQ